MAAAATACPPPQASRLRAREVGATREVRDALRPGHVVRGGRHYDGAIRSGRIRHASYERQIEQLRVHGNTAIVMGHETVVDTGPVIRHRYTEVWIRAGERWQAVARHANEIRVG